MSREAYQLLFRVQEDAEESTKGLRMSSHKGSKTTRNKSHSRRRE